MRTADARPAAPLGEPRPHAVRPAHALLGRADRRADARRRRVDPPVRLVRHRRGRGGGWSSTSRSGCSSGWRRRSTGSASSCSCVVLVVGTGAGTAQSSHSWLSIGGHQIGQPSELAKVATVLMLARYLSGRKEPPRSLRDLLVPGLIVGVPFLLVLKQPDLGSAIVFIGILFAMLFWAGRAAPAPVPARLARAQPAAGVQQLGVGRSGWWCSRRCSSSGARTSTTRCWSGS